MGDHVQRGDLTTLHAAEGGLSDLHFDANAVTYARHLSRYLTCPSTIQAHVRRNYGVTFKLADIGAMQQRFGSARKAYRIAADRIEAKPEDYFPFRVGPAEPIKPSRAAQLPAKAPVLLVELTTEPGPPPVLASEIISAVAQDMGATTEDVIGRSRKPRMVRARMMVAYVLHKRGHSLAAVGRRMGRDHTSIIYLVRKFEDTATSGMRELAARHIGTAVAKTTQREALRLGMSHLVQQEAR